MKAFLYFYLFVFFLQTLNCSAYTHTGNPTASGVMPQVGVCAADGSRMLAVWPPVAQVPD